MNIRVNVCDGTFHIALMINFSAKCHLKKPIPLTERKAHGLTDWGVCIMLNSGRGRFLACSPHIH